jgi:uncharacterized protein (DUF58 family)
MPANQLLDRDFIQKIERLSLVSRKVFVGSIQGERRSKKRGISSEFADHRDYSPGDDTRFIDWNIYGRLDRLFLKLFLEEEDLHVYVLMDVSESMGHGDPSKIDYARRVAAALAYIGLANMDRVCVGAFAHDMVGLFPPTRGKAQMWRLFDFLANVRPGGETSLAASCRSFSLRNRGKGVVVIVSDFFDPQGYETALRSFLAKHMDIFLLHVLSPQEVEPTLVGDLRLLDCETATEAEVSISAPLLKVYKRNLSLFCGGLREYCARRGINYLFATTRVPFDQLVLNYLRKAGLVK